MRFPFTSMLVALGTLSFCVRGDRSPASRELRQMGSEVYFAFAMEGRLWHASGPSRGALCRRGSRPSEPSTDAVCYDRFTSTPAICCPSAARSGPAPQRVNQAPGCDMTFSIVRTIRRLPAARPSVIQLSPGGGANGRIGQDTGRPAPAGKTKVPPKPPSVTRRCARRSNPGLSSRCYGVHPDTVRTEQRSRFAMLQDLR